ncbi:MAG: four helix bundle protein [Sporocytophaga sp.]|nr:four helix bundle protein [Sporocytophaga sp.]
MFPFEKLLVYQKAFHLNKSIYKYIKNSPQLPSYLKNQLGRASLSIMLNIAEGIGKKTSKDRKNFLIISRGSTLGCAALIQFLASENEMAQNLQMKICSDLEEVSKMLYTMIKNLEKASNSEQKQ